MDGGKYVGVVAASRMYGVSEYQLRRWAREGKYGSLRETGKSGRVGKFYLVQAELAEYLQRAEAVPAVQVEQMDGQMKMEG